MLGPGNILLAINAVRSIPSASMHWHVLNRELVSLGVHNVHALVDRRKTCETVERHNFCTFDHSIPMFYMLYHLSQVNQQVQ